MFNLLSSSHIRTIKRAYRSLFLKHLSIGGIIILFLGFILLAPGFVVYYLNQHVLVGQENEARNVKQAIDAKLIDDINNASQFIIAFNSRTTQKIEPTITDIINKRGSSIKITSIQYERKDGSIEVQGIAPSRATLLGFAKELKTIKGVKEVDVPVSSYALESDIPFTATVVLLPQ